MPKKSESQEKTLDATAISKLPWMTAAQGAIYIHRGISDFYEFARKHHLPYASVNPENPKSRRVYPRSAIDEAMWKEINQQDEQHHETGLSQAAEARVKQIVGTSQCQQT